MADDFQTQNPQQQTKTKARCGAYDCNPGAGERERQKDAWVSLASNPKQGAPGSTRDHVSTYRAQTAPEKHSYAAE